MAYIGNTAGNRFVASQPASVYSGDGSTTVFTLEHSVASDEDILVSVDGVVQEPSVAYAVSGGTTLTFTSAPSNNTGNNIFVYYLFRTVATVDHPSTSSLLATDGTFSGDLTVDTTTLHVDSANNRVGIGTASPSYLIDAQTSSGNAQFQLKSGGDLAQIILHSTNTGGNSQINFADADSNNIGMLQYGHVDNSMRFKTNSTEAMRIDSSGNLLVSKTAGGSGTAGIQLESGGRGGFTKDGAYVTFQNRLSSNGEISRFMKDGTTVGSIGTQNGSDFYITGTASDDTGLRFQTNEIVPVNDAGGNRGDAIDLGKSNIRFKDLYLSGGAYLGGTGSANYLDDYEEGTWTPSLSFGGGSTGIGYNLQNGTYTKIGRLVHVNFAISLSNKGSSTGNVGIGGLPFTIGDTLAATSIEASGAVGLHISFNNVYGNISMVALQSNELILYRKTSATGSLNIQLTHTEFNNNSDFRASITYYIT